MVPPADSCVLEARIECGYEAVPEHIVDPGYAGCTAAGPAVHPGLAYTKSQAASKPKGLVRRLCSVIFDYKPAKDLDEWRQGYVKLVSWCWVLLMGPFAGWHACANITAGNNSDMDVFESMLYLLFFIFGLLCLAFNRNKICSRLWLLVGIVLIGTIWFRYAHKEFHDDYEKRLPLMWILTIFYTVTLLMPLTLTDPLLLNIFCD